MGARLPPGIPSAQPVAAGISGPAIAAFTASATQRVRHDIVEQLHLRDPFKRIASFCRPNLRLLVRESTRSEQEAILLESLRSMEEGSAIVYASTIKRVEEVREFLEKGGVKAVAYHGKMGAEERRQNQQLWSADEVRVVVARLPLDWHQQAKCAQGDSSRIAEKRGAVLSGAGRAGRDGDAADCLLLWQKRDQATIGFFIGQIEDEREKERAWQRFHESGICGQQRLSSARNLPSFWRTTEVAIVRKLRCLRGIAGMDFAHCARAGDKRNWRRSP